MAAVKPNDDEGALLDAARAGDTNALSVLLERYQPRVLRFGLRMCRNFDDAQDIVQDTLLTAARSMRQFRGQSSLSTWLYTIARSYCIKKHRRSKFAPEHEESLDDTSSPVAQQLPSAGKSPEEAAMDRELEAALFKAIQNLEPMYKEVLVLRDVEGLSAAEVSQVVGASVGAVKSRLHRARAAVRDTLVPFLEPQRAAAPPSPAGKPDCPDVIEMFSRFLEGEITDELCRSLQAHVDGCARCQQKCHSLQQVVQMCRTERLPTVPDELRSTVQRALRELQPNKPTGSLR